jgi:hypothetical protein
VDFAFYPKNYEYQNCDRAISFCKSKLFEYQAYFFEVPIQSAACVEFKVIVSVHYICVSEDVII